ncbi:hypothetical protein [Psychrobacillus sp. FSL K6-1464]|uniref:hypothetical protein n=1 Tax=Psychrobacillus sp. FSL K6-1464 TaxID=2921545 RepID=UPI0030F5BA21
MSKLLEELKAYKESCRYGDDDYEIENQAEVLVFESVKLIERYEQALKEIDNIHTTTLYVAQKIAQEALKES